MQAATMFSNLLKNPMLGAPGGFPPHIPAALAVPGASSSGPSSGFPHGPSSSASSLPPGSGDDGVISAAQPGRSSSALNSSVGGGIVGGHVRPRSGSPATPNAQATTKRTKLEPEEGDVELEIDVRRKLSIWYDLKRFQVQNDDASSSVVAPLHTNGRTSQPSRQNNSAKDTERDSASASSSRDSATPRSIKQQVSLGILFFLTFQQYFSFLFSFPPLPALPQPASLP